MKSRSQPIRKLFTPATNVPEAKQSAPVKLIINNRTAAIAQRQVQQHIDTGFQPYFQPTYKTSGSVAQRLIDPGSFKKQTSKGFSIRGRSTIKAIDDKLAAYDLLKGSPADIVKRESALQELAILCTTYLSKKATKGLVSDSDESDRVKGVRSLQNDIVLELSYIAPAALAHTLTDTDPKEALKELFKAKDKLAAVKNVRREPDIPALFKAIRIKTNDAGNRAAIMRDIILEDVEALEEIGRTTANSDLKSIIEEIIDNVKASYFREAQLYSGATLAKPSEGLKEKYVVEMQLEQTDTTIRLSSLLHELNHVAVHKKFDNTVIHLAYPKHWKEDEIITFSKKRTEQINKLKAILENEKAVFISYQYEALKEKLDYPISKDGKNTLKSYADTFLKKKETSLSPSEHSAIMNLVNKGANNTLVEFDTVINQMFFMLNGWGIDENLAFYQELKTVAKEAYQHRHA